MVVEGKLHTNSYILIQLIHVFLCCSLCDYFAPPCVIIFSLSGWTLYEIQKAHSFINVLSINKHDYANRKHLSLHYH